MLTQTRQIRDFMTTDPITITPMDSVETVLSHLEAQHISGLPVVDDAGKVVGIVSEADLLFKERPIRLPLYITFLGGIIYLKPLEHFVQQLKKCLGMSVQDVMTPNPMTITPDTSIAQAATLMLDKRINRLPVVDATGKLVGIITRNDLLRALQ